MALHKPEGEPKEKKKSRRDNQPSPMKVLAYCFAITGFFLILGLLKVYVF